MALRQRFGPLAQGPAAIVSRHGDEAVFATDAMGLRPLWQFETPYELVFSSERGVFSAEEFVSEPKPLAPGEKVYLRLTPKGPRCSPLTATSGRSWRGSPPARPWRGTGST